MTNSFYPEHLGAMIVSLTLLTGMVFWGMLAYGASRNGQAGNRLPAPWLLTGIAGWYGVVMFLVFNGAATLARGPLGLPNLVLVMSPPIAIGLLALRHSGFRRMLDGIPLALLAGFHILRAYFGLFFLALYEMGAIPAAFAFRGGYGDIAAGVLGGLAMLLLMLGARRSVTLPVMALLTVEGLLDFGLVLYTGLTAVPVDGAFQGFHPFFLIPALEAFGVEVAEGKGGQFIGNILHARPLLPLAIPPWSHPSFITYTPVTR